MKKGGHQPPFSYFRIVTEQLCNLTYNKELNGARYVYNDSSQLEQVRRHNGNTTFVYDEEGKLAQKLSHAGNTTYSYNKYVFLDQVCLPDGKCITYTYDPLERRSSKLVHGKITEKYCWKDMLRLQAACTGEDEDHVVFNYPESEKNNLQPTSLSCNGKKYSLAYSNVGTLLAIADESGRVVHIEETDSFGRRLSRHKLANVAMLSFGGGQLDEDTGLVHFLFRDYDPATGFFIQRDPLGLRGGDVDVYGYCLDDPVNMVDPLALMGVVNDLVPPDPENYDRYSVSDIEIDNQKGEFNIYHDGKLQKSYRVESGRTGVTDSSIKDRGLTPSGEYYINPKKISQVEGVPYLLRRVTGDWGHGRVPLHPSKETDTKGRDGFFIHGGVTPGSAGCQDIGSNDREFFHNAQRNGAKIRVIIK